MKVLRQHRWSAAQLALFVNGPNSMSSPSRRTTMPMVSSLEPCAMAMMLTFARDGGEYPPGESRCPPHALSDDRKQAYVIVHLDWFQVAVSNSSDRLFPTPRAPSAHPACVPGSRSFGDNWSW